MSRLVLKRKSVPKPEPAPAPAPALASAGGDDEGTSPSGQHKIPLKLLKRLEEKTMLGNGVSWVGRPFREDYPQLWDDYRKRIAMPMDLRTVRENLQAGIYLPKAGEKVPPDFVRDVRRIWTNAMQYNPQGNEYHEAAKKHLKWFDDKIAGV